MRLAADQTVLVVPHCLVEIFRADLFGLLRIAVVFRVTEMRPLNDRKVED